MKDEPMLKVHLSPEETEFVARYARDHGITVDDVVDRSVRLLRRVEESGIHPDVLEMSGLVPEDVDARDEYLGYLLRKHR